MNFTSYLPSGLKVAPDAPMFNGLVYEFSALALAVVVIVHCYTTRGKWDALIVYVVGLLYGLVLENGGPLQIPELGFEGYFWEENYQIYLFEFFGHGIRLSQVPLVTVIGWPQVFYTAVIFYEQVAKVSPRVQNSAFLAGLTISASGLLTDLAFDVLATRFNWWVWNEAFLQLWFGVPLMNFIAWFWAVAMFGWFWAYFHRKEEILGQAGWKNASWRVNLGEKKYREKKRQITKRLAACLPLMWVLDTIGVMATKEIVTWLGFMYL